MYAINQEVYGLEIVVSEIGTEIERFEGGVKIETQNVEIYLTQHESPRPKINDAISRFKNWENFQKYRGETIAAPATQANLRRYLISGQFQCTC
jgi:hypothetical protein